MACLSHLSWVLIKATTRDNQLIWSRFGLQVPLLAQCDWIYPYNLNCRTWTKKVAEWSQMMACQSSLWITYTYLFILSVIILEPANELLWFSLSSPMVNFLWSGGNTMFFFFFLLSKLNHLLYKCEGCQYVRLQLLLFVIYVTKYLTNDTAIHALHFHKKVLLS